MPRFLRKTKSTSHKRKKDKLDLIKVKNFWSLKKNKKLRKQIDQIGKKIFAKGTSNYKYF